MSTKPPIKTCLYIDGFNLYYGALKDTPYKWLNPVLLVGKLFPRNQIVSVKFCSAKISPLPGNPDAPTRQQTYWRALRTIPGLEIVEGHFRCREKRMKVVKPPPRTIEVFNTEEKGSDVNLASHLLLDAFRNRFDVAIVISGDSDLLSPIRMVREELGKAVGVINPQLTSGPYKRPDKRGSAGLKQAASFYRGDLSDSQVSGSVFPDILTDAQGAFHKPAAW